MRAMILLLFLGKASFGHAQSIDNYSNFSTLGVTRFNNFKALGKKNTEELDYSEIRGNCFWDREWNPALLVLKKGGDVKLKNVKLNLYTNDIHYLDNLGAELVALTNTTKIIFFDKNDTTKVSAVFQRFASLTEKNKESFGQVLVGGEIQLIKNYTVSLNKEFDHVNAESEFRFRTDIHYLILDHENEFPLKNLNKTSILSVIKPNKEQEAWLHSNKNKLKTEADVISFLTFCNESRKTQ